jgi:NAD(P)-dependent dehydrogenase (short-subunit alcohol dehydrogenase family)
MKLKDKIALVTGGTSGIGLVTAQRFQQEGAQVIVTGRNAGRLEEAARVLGTGATLLRVDLRQVGPIVSAIDDIRKRHGRIDVLFANAGAGTAGPLDAVTEEQFDEQVALNLKGSFFTVQKAAPLLSPGASVILTTSFLNAIGMPGLSVLSATKAAVRSLARSLAAELAPRGIRVNAVSPGPIRTPFHSKLGLSEAQLAQSAQAIASQVTLGRFGEASEVATAAVFLASADSSYMTGAELVVDGGLSQV